jgi:hypothetical protein
MSDESFFWSRLRWRLRGAWMWPAFIALTLADGLILHLLPPVRTGVDVIPGILLATFGNLVLIGALAPWLARRLSARRSPPPSEAEREVLKDRVGTALLAAGLAGVVASGLATRPVVVLETEQRERAANALLDYVERNGSDELRRNLEPSNTIRLADGFFRTCIPSDDRRRYTCFFLDAEKRPVEIVKDPSAEPNSTYRVP